MSLCSKEIDHQKFSFVSLSTRYFHFNFTILLRSYVYRMFQKLLHFPSNKTGQLFLIPRDLNMKKKVILTISLYEEILIR